VSERTAPLVRWASVVALVAVTACASGSTPVASLGDPSVSSASPTAAPAGEPGAAWIAVLDTAADPARLNGARKDVLRQLGDVLEGSVVISPGACLEGLPDDLTDGYVLAIQRDTPEDVRSFVSLLSQEPLFTGGVTIVCSD
jgi:ABC-type amino acid transport substrate-binding protein